MKSFQEFVNETDENINEKFSDFKKKSDKKCDSKDDSDDSESDSKDDGKDKKLPPWLKSKK